MKTFKKIAVSCLLICLCLSVGAVSASADYDRFSTTEYIFDIEMDDWGREATFYVSFDFEEMEARINSYTTDSGLYDVVIPSYFEYAGNKYTLTEIAGGNYNELQESVEIPATVTKIVPKSIGYYREEVYIEDYYWDEDGNFVDNSRYGYEYYKLDYFTIYCEEDTAAHIYAIENEFNYEISKSLENAEIVMADTEIYYTGWEIEPEFTLMYNESSLINGRDFEVEYDSNIDAGEASFTIYGIGEYRGTITQNFTIRPLPASKLTFSKISDQYYYGYSVYPDVSVKHGDRYLSSWYDYDVTYTDNECPGTGKITFEFYGNYTGTKVIKFKILVEPMQNVTATAHADSVDLYWSYINCDEYRVYIYNSKTKKYDGLKKTKSNYYTHKSRKQLTTYKYAVKGVIYDDSGKAHTSKTVYLTVTTKPTTPTLKLTTKNKAVTVKWSRNSKVDGYQVYRMTNWEYNMEKVKTIKGYETGSWTNKNLSNDKDYYFAVRSYKKVDGKTIYSDFSEHKYSGSSSSRLNGATLKPKKSFKVYNVQGKETKLAWTTTLSDNDIKILKKFAKKHFTDDMSREDVLKITLEWINRNVTYATGTLWNDIQGMSYVEAIFSAKKGQCVQYNGAMAAMMTYLGYDVQLVQGYRYSSYSGSTWQHFWVEAKIAGNTYVFETGNYGRDGTWSYFCKKYSETMGYMRNGKRVS